MTFLDKYMLGSFLLVILITFQGGLLGCIEKLYCRMQAVWEDDQTVANATETTGSSARRLASRGGGAAGGLTLAGAFPLEPAAYLDPFNCPATGLSDIAPFNTCDGAARAMWPPHDLTLCRLTRDRPQHMVDWLHTRTRMQVMHMHMHTNPSCRGIAAGLTTSTSHSRPSTCSCSARCNYGPRCATRGCNSRLARVWIELRRTEPLLLNATGRVLSSSFTRCAEASGC